MVTEQSKDSKEMSLGVLWVYLQQMIGSITRQWQQEQEGPVIKVIPETVYHECPHWGWKNSYVHTVAKAGDLEGGGLERAHPTNEGYIEKIFLRYFSTTYHFENSFL